MPVSDVDPWLQEAQQANDSEAMQWFTRTVLRHVEVREQNHKRPITLNVLHIRRLRFCIYMENLTWTDLHTIANTYQC